MANSVIGALRVMLGMDTAEFESGATRAQRSAQRFEKDMKKLGGNLQKIGAGMTVALTAPLAAFGASSFKVASDAAELQSAFDQTFGELAGSMNEWAKQTGDAMGRSTQSMQQLANTFGIFFNQAAPTREEAAEMSKTFAELAQDLASFYNVTEDDALAKLRSGLSGESEPLRDFGVFLNEAAVQAKALEMGLTGANNPLTEQEKIMARYALILESTTNAQGDVARTADGTANQMRKAQAAFEELQVVIGTKLLPVLTPFIEKIGALLTSFSELPEGVQTAVVAFAGVAAALGPVLTVVGTVAKLAGAAATAFAGFGGMSAVVSTLGAAFTTLGAVVSTLAAPLAAIAAVGVVIYREWDRIAPMLAEFWAAIQQALGPPLQELVGAVSSILSELWNGPMGEGISSALGLVKDFGSVVLDIFGESLVRVLRGALQLIVNVFEGIGNAITMVARLLKGDFSGAWQAAMDLVTGLALGFLRVIEAVFPEAADYARDLYYGVKTWLQEKLGQVFEWVGKKVKAVTNFFFEMYDAVVGNSYVPDMVDGIQREFLRLQNVMVDPAQRATETVEDQMRTLASRVRSILAEIYPEIEAAAVEADKIAALREAEAAGLITAATRRDAVRRMQLDRLETGPLTKAEDITGAARKVASEMERVAGRTEVQTVRIAETFQDMVDRSLGALRRLADGIRGGGFLNILEGVSGIVTTLGGFGVFGSKFRDALRSTPGYANGGMMRLGGIAGVDRNVLSLNGSPIARVSAGETMEIRPANDRGTTTVVNNYYTLPSDEFWNRVDGRAAAVAQPVAQATVGRAFGRMREAQGRSLVG